MAYFYFHYYRFHVIFMKHLRSNLLTKKQHLEKIEVQFVLISWRPFELSSNLDLTFGFSQRHQKTGLLLFKKRKARLHLLFSNDPAFFHPDFCNPMFGPDFFQGHEQTHVFKTKIVGAD